MAKDIALRHSTTLNIDAFPIKGIFVLEFRELLEIKGK
jgi:hypothetical protein